MSERHFLTTNTGVPISDNQNSQTAGQRGPTLLQDYQLLEKIAHFDRERIPERVVHARGAGAHGVFESYGTAAPSTRANFLQKGKQTPVFVRFSTVVPASGSPETVRDPRGFAVKFYTEEGNYDLVGNDLPVFFIRDAMKFPDMVHAFKPDPRTNIVSQDRFWDFLSHTPESTHMLIWLFSDRGIPANYRQMAGFGVHTFLWVDAQGKASYVKYHWVPKQEIKCLQPAEAAKVGGMDPAHATRDLYEAIERGDYPEWELQVQIVDPSQEQTLDFDPLDATKVIPEDRFPLLPVGRMVLNRNPQNYFAEVEQAAFAPAVLVPGIELSGDKLLQGRAFSYPDTQRYRLGANYLQIPVNCPYAPVRNHQRDGAMTTKADPSPMNYEPSSYAGHYVEAAASPDHTPAPAGHVVRLKIAQTNDFHQAGERFRSLTAAEQERLIANLTGDLAKVTAQDVQERVVCNFARADVRLGLALAQGLQLQVPASAHHQG